MHETLQSAIKRYGFTTPIPFYNLAKAGKAPFFKLGGTWFTVRQEFDAWLKEQRASAPYYKGRKS